MPPLASVIIPVYNNSAFVRPCVESIIGQDYQNIELIIVDDGSTDDTLSIITSFVARNITIISQANQGPSGAINRGFDLAKGEFIFLQGGDDVSAPGRVRSQIEMLTKTGADIVACKPSLIDASGAFLPVDMSPFERKVSISPPNSILSELFFGMNFICAPSVAMTRAARNTIGEAHLGLIQLQDYEYWLRATALGKTLLIDDEPVLAYRIHDNNMSRNPKNYLQSDKEIVYILQKIAVLLDIKQIAALLESQRPALEIRDAENAPRHIVLPFLFIVHSLPAVRQIGFNMLLDLFIDRANDDLLSSHMGFSRRDLYRKFLMP